MAKIIGFKSNLTVREIKKKLATNIFFPRRRVGHKFKEKIKWNKIEIQAAFKILNFKIGLDHGWRYRIVK